MNDREKLARDYQRLADTIESARNQAGQLAHTQALSNDRREIMLRMASDLFDMHRGVTETLANITREMKSSGGSR